MRIIIAICIFHSLFSLPVNPVTVMGSAEHMRSGNELSVIASDGSLIEWTSFSIDQNETTRFSLPNQSSTVLNRVVSQIPSQILGKLESNGQVLLINPNGVIFGKESQINVHHLIATTFDLNEGIKNKMGTIEHFGEIRSLGGTIELKASHVLIHEGASLIADGGGDGGKITVFGEEFAKMAGHMSARGGELGGNGGRLEVSTHGLLDITGTVSTLAPFGETGLFIIDPLNLTIAAANVNVTGATPFVPTAPGAMLDAATVTAALGTSNVRITTVGTVGPEPGNITVASPINWASGTILTLESTNDITINPGADIQESSGLGTGGVILIAPDTGTITITGTNVLPTSVGSANGITFIGDPNIAACARARPNLSIQGVGAVATANIGVRLGFTGAVATGPIDVSCNTLDLVSFQSSAQIGHGINAPMSLTVNAPITVSASGAITIALGAGGTFNSYSFIGHGANTFTGGGTNLIGDIQVSSEGDIMLLSAIPARNTRIGHGNASNLPFTGQITLIQGDVSVASGGTITLNTVTSSLASIGHYGAQNSNPITAIGDIYVSAILDVILTGTAGSSGSLIAHFNNVPGTIPNLNSNIVVSAGRDIYVGVFGANIGAGRNTIGHAAGAAANLNGDVYVLAGRDLNLQIRAPAGIVAPRIGNTATGNGTSNTFVGVGRNLNFPNPSTAPSIITAPGEVNVAVSGDLLATVLTQVNFISTANTLPSPLATTRIWVGGNLNATANLFLGSPTGAGQNSNVDIRVGNTLTTPNNFSTTTGSVFIAAPTLFTPGQLWTSALNPTRLATACLQGSAAGIVFPNCFTFPNIALNSPINTPALTSTLPAISITTTSGDITLSNPFSFSNDSPQTTNNSAVMLTACNFCTQASNDLILGPGSTQINTTSGDIITGTFRNITVNQAITTSGNIDITACQNLVTNGNISTTFNGFVHLSGGNVTILGGVNTVNGPICFNANQTLDLASDIISIGGGTITAVADALLLSANLATTAPIILISQNMVLSPLAAISSDSQVTLVVDRDNPSIPLVPGIPLGTFTMDSGASITSGPGFPISIFAAMQNLVNIAGTLNGSTFVPGTLFQDTATEVWCLAPPILIDCPSCQFQMGCSANCPSFPLFADGLPFTIYYKGCIQLLTQQAMVIATEINLDLHPYDEFPGWKEQFYLIDRFSGFKQHQVYFIRKRLLNIFNHPKSWAALMPE